MSNEMTVRWGWLKGMYIYTIVGAGGFGLGIIVIPDVMRSIFGWPNQDPIIYGVSGSVYLGFAVISLLGLWYGEWPSLVSHVENHLVCIHRFQLAFLYV
jgi:hypothetical protein